MLDHQPRELKEAEKAGVDILLSGHTHKGQLAPANLVTEILFENDGGISEKTKSYTPLFLQDLGLGVHRSALVVARK